MTYRIHFEHLLYTTRFEKSVLLLKRQVEMFYFVFHYIFF